MSENGMEFSGRTVEEAIAAGLAALELERDEADIEIVQHPRRRFLGRVDAVVRISAIDDWEEQELVEPGPQSRVVGQPEPETVYEDELDEDEYDEEFPEEEAPYSPVREEGRSRQDSAGRPRQDGAARSSPSRREPAPKYEEGIPTPSGEEHNEEVALETLSELLNRMGFSETETQKIWTGVEEGNPALTLNVRGDQLGRLIGRHGATLNSLQFILRLLLSQQLREWPSITVDVDGYRLKQQTNLTRRAMRIAEEVVSKGRPQTLEAMSAADRRIVHMALQDHPHVYTESRGSGTHRKIVVYAQ